MTMIRKIMKYIITGLLALVAIISISIFVCFLYFNEDMTLGVRTHFYRMIVCTKTKDANGNNILLDRITQEYLVISATGGLVDPVEYSRKYLAIEKQLDKELAPMRKDHIIGQCYGIWGRKKTILKEKYGIDWRSPHDLNPGVFYD